MAYKQEIRNEAFALFTQEKSIPEISKILGVTKTTLFNWKKADKWVERHEKIKKKALEKFNDDLSEVKLRQLRVVKAVLTKFAQRLLNDPKLKITYKDADAAMKHELLLIGEPTERIESKDAITIEDLKQALNINDEE